jgi:hypothetical protein
MLILGIGLGIQRQDASEIGGGSPPAEEFNIITEDGIDIITEDGTEIVSEEAP